MRKVVSQFSTALLGYVVNAKQSDKLHFVQEVVRHGARAPTTDPTGFKVVAGELTASGMRQRFLLGTENRKRYIEEYGLISEEDWVN